MILFNFIYHCDYSNIEVTDICYFELFLLKFIHLLWVSEIT